MRARAQDPLTFRDEPDALAPETLLVFEFVGGARAFEKAVNSIPGLEWIAEDDEASFQPIDDEPEEYGVAYLAVPDQQALQQIERLWALWVKGQNLPNAHRDWAKIFETLRDLRRWGPADRVSDAAAEIIRSDAAQGGFVFVEIELIFRAAGDVAAAERRLVVDAVLRAGGAVESQVRFDHIAYDALLVTIPAAAAASIAERSADSLASLVPIYSILPQSLVTVETSPAAEDGLRPPEERPAGEPIVALLDGVPMVNHELLEGRIRLDDPDDLTSQSLAEHNHHGTAMASLIIHGDLLAGEAALPRPIYVRPILLADRLPFRDGEKAEEHLPKGQLIVDIIARAVHRMKVGDDEAGPVAPRILVVNLSVCDRNRPFFHRLSALARAIDWLSAEYGITFTVSAGNAGHAISVAEAVDDDEFSALQAPERAKSVLRSVFADMAARRILAPAEALNALTIGAAHIGVQTTTEKIGIGNYDPYADLVLPNPTSRLGLGYHASIKPEFLMAGGKERVRSTLGAGPYSLQPSTGGRFGGLQVAATGVDSVGLPRRLDWCGGTSAATALATRAQHRIHDALIEAYPAEFGTLPDVAKAVILKALVTHRARWPEQEKDLVEAVIGPAGGKKWQARRANVMRFFGYGIPDIDEVISCVDSRATLWASGRLVEDQAAVFSIPLPEVLAGQKTYHAISATLAWFAPVVPGRQMYRAVRLTIEEPDEGAIGSLGIEKAKNQPDTNAVNRGTVVHRRWDGDRVAAFAANGVLELSVARKPDNGRDIPGAVEFGLALTIEAPELVGIYQAVINRIDIKPRIPIQI